MTRLTKMRRLSLKSLAAATLLTLAPTMTAQAAVTNVSASPSTVRVSPDGGTVSLTWQITVTRGAGGTGLVSSPAVTIQLGGSTLETVSSTLSRNVASGSGVVTFSETLSVSASVARQLAKSGSTARVQRSFTDAIDGGNDTGGPTLQLVGGAGQLNFSRVELLFNDGNRKRIVGRREQLNAIADIRYSGSGTLQAEWKVSTVDAVRGSNTFRTLRLVRRPLAGSGSGRVRLSSPSLPTLVPGLYEVKLEFTDGNVTFTEPSIRYYVVPDELTGRTAIQLIKPDNDAHITSATVFAWTPVSGAAAYQLEIHSALSGDGSASATAALLLDDGEPPLTGRLVPASVTSTSLTELSLRHLTGSGDLRWRIRALGRNGEVLGISPYRTLRQ